MTPQLQEAMDRLARAPGGLDVWFCTPVTVTKSVVIEEIRRAGGSVNVDGAGVSWRTPTGQVKVIRFDEI